MQTPICDFVNKYAKDKKIRLHMPGHKGNSFLGIEEFDITEVQGADSLYEPSGIIAQSEKTQVLFLTAPPFIQPKGRRSAYAPCFILPLFMQPKTVLCEIKKKQPIKEKPPKFTAAKRKMSPHRAIMSACETLPLSECVGRVLAFPNVSCPPAVPILVCGEVIDKKAIECMRYYGISECAVVK